jgi:hypothetical protein
MQREVPVAQSSFLLRNNVIFVSPQATIQQLNIFSQVFTVVLPGFFSAHPLRHDRGVAKRYT